VLLALSFTLSACSFETVQALFGYIEPPKITTIGEELKLEYERCMKIAEEENCAQAAFDIVRTVKGLEPRTVPKGIVIILEGDGGYGDIDREIEKENIDSDEEKTQQEDSQDQKK